MDVPGFRNIMSHEEEARAATQELQERVKNLEQRNDELDGQNFCLVVRPVEPRIPCRAVYGYKIRAFFCTAQLEHHCKDIVPRGLQEENAKLKIINKRLAQQVFDLKCEKKQKPTTPNMPSRC